MRSPSPSECAHIVQPNDPAKLKKACKSYRKQKSPEVKPSIATSEASNLPYEIASQTISVTNPSDIFSRHQDINDRRLRLLLRRLTNQIQYGCKSVTCNTTTCLSCRKRNTRAPLRRYTDLGARALACHLISEGISDNDLCRNEPNVPWFEDPGQRETRAKKSNMPHGSLRRSPRPSENGDYVHANGNVKTSSPKPLQALKMIENPNEPPAVVNLNDILENGQRLTRTQSPSSAIKDPKSFTQILFDTLPLRLLEWFPSSRSSTRRSSLSEKAELRSSASCKASEKDVAQSNGHVIVPHKSVSIEPSTFPLSTDDGEPNQSSSYSKTAGILLKSTELGTGQQGTEQFMNGHLENLPIPRMTDSDDCGQITNVKTDVTDIQETSQNKFQWPPLGAISASTKSIMKDVSTSSNVSGHQNLSILTISTLSPPVLDWLATASSGDSKTKNGVEMNDMNNDHKNLSQLIDQSFFYCTKNPDIVLRSIYDWHRSHGHNSKTLESFKMDSHAMDEWLKKLCEIRPVPMLLRNLRLALKNAYIPPPWLQNISNHAGRLNMKKRHAAENMPDFQKEGYMPDDKVADICFTSLYTLIWMMWSHYKMGCANISAWDDLYAFRDHGSVFSAHIKGRLTYTEEKEITTNDPLHGVLKDVLRLTDNLDDFDANRLLESVMEIISVRTAFTQIARARQSRKHTKQEKKTKNLEMPELIVNHFKRTCGKARAIDGDTNVITTLEWLRTLMLNKWDGSPVVRRAGPIGGALQLMATLYTDYQEFKVEPTKFQMGFIADRLDTMDMPVAWLSFRPNNKSVHLLSYSFLFTPKSLVTYFRAINYASMSKCSADARAIYNDVRQFGLNDSIPVYGADDVMINLRPHMVTLLVLTIRRDNVLTDAINQVWRRQRRELLRPLKVRMGMDEGEQGIDIGGVQQEFFRIVFAQAVDTEYGMFTIDDKTRMTWFQPTSLEPLYKFEVLGILMSIAVYNSITLPVTFPIAFYRKLLSLKVKKVKHISDGWPELSKGLQKMLDWSDGDVGDVFVRSYMFSFEAYGKQIDVDMQKFQRDTPWPPSERKKGKEKAKTASFEFPHNDVEDDEVYDTVNPATDTSEASLVINETREQYVKDYIFWLTDKSVRPQYEAFARGFYTCLDRTALSIFTPEALQLVVEGYQTIDIDGLERATKYEDGFDTESPAIRDFWHVVRSFSMEQHRRLLEFVTASDRVPVNGICSVQFIVQRNGSGDERLPTSMTCFGRLLLPEYSSRAVLEEKLSKAIENSEGFGVA